MMDLPWALLWAPLSLVWLYFAIKLGTVAYLRARQRFEQRFGKGDRHE